ncbi:MAG: prepilin-type N-terminal cleavage/methylation domain-containing protein [Candidatus Pacebacteria bacterium]|nr:prepilin-type N-terminal cleavage/methylation domain-containing protein [Candidatus Paceibacterota bacterium]MBP9866455.1 prepilin-type N-terminal cleavage/methylation domain-containing protein [Candidatus Paceibacterota bacterium]
MSIYKKNIRGFTLLEMALSISILGIIFAMSGPLYRVFMVRNDLDITVSTMVQNLRRAQTLSQVADGDSEWGVHVATGSILLYKGFNYALRNEAFDENTEIPTNISVSGLLTITYQKKTGIPQSVGTTTFTSVTNETRNVTINQKGMVDY